MAGIFEQIELTWKGSTYVIPPSRVLRAIAAVEDVVTLQQLAVSPSSLSFAKLAMAYGKLLRFAGARATDDEVYVVLWDTAGEGANIVTMVQTLMTMMLPPELRKRIAGQLDQQELENIPPADNVGKVEPPQMVEAS